MSQLVADAKSPFAARQAGDLILPPPVPLRRRGKRRPPPVEEIACRMAPLCRQRGITRLEIFGSVARTEAKVGNDFDLIATFPEHPGLEIVTIEAQCAKLLDVPVHLLTAEAVEEMTNPYRKESIQQDRRVACASSGESHPWSRRAIAASFAECRPSRSAARA